MDELDHDLVILIAKGSLLKGLSKDGPELNLKAVAVIYVPSRK